MLRWQALPRLLLERRVRLWKRDGRLFGPDGLLRARLYRGDTVRMRLRVSFLITLVLCCGVVANCRDTSTDTNAGKPDAATGGIAGSGGSEGGPGGAGGTSADSSTGASGGLISTDGNLPHYDGPEYDGDQTCEPNTSPFQRASCCNGTPCFGNCELHDGTWQCFCYGIVGGCGKFGLVCCVAGAGCKEASSCDFGPP